MRAEEEAVPRVKFKVLEKGGTTIQRILQNTNPTATPGCSDRDCVACVVKRGSGGKCRKGNTTYQMECLQCEELANQTNKQMDRTTYIGETSRNLYTREKNIFINISPAIQNLSCRNTKMRNTTASRQCSMSRLLAVIEIAYAGR